MSADGYELIRSDRRTLSLTVRPDGTPLVRAPRRLPKAAVDRFVADKADWIARQRAALALRPAHTYQDGDRVAFCGTLLTLSTDPSARSVRRSGDVLILPAGDAAAVRSRLIRWYKSQAKSVFAARVRALAPEAGVLYGPVRVSDAATRWGSCGKHDSINLNWRLLLAPPEILDYVVVHELCHIGRRDHSPAFWARVQRLMPDWKSRRAWLSAHRFELEL